MISDKDLLSRQQARQLAQKAKEAAQVLAKFSQSQVDAMIDAVAAAVDKEVETLARMAVEETGFGNVPDKIIKNRFSSRDVYRFIRPLKTVGVIGEDKERKIIMVAEPVGVVAAIIPSTNPTSTAIYKVLISLKGRNSIVLSPHPSAKNCICYAANIMIQAAQAAGAPEGAITCLTDVSSEGTQELMQDRNVSLILSTGGMGIVRLAYSCGKPAFGVGPGNVPAFIDTTADVPKAVRDIITGKTFDNGTLCSAEQAIVCESSIKEKVIEELRKLKAYFLNDDEINAVAKVVVTPTFGANPRIVGKTAAYIAAQAGIQAPPDTPVLIAPLKGVGKEYPLSIEKLSPVLAFYEVSDFNSGVERCVQLVRFGGMGHTMSFHSNDQQRIVEVGLRVPVSRVVINSPSTHGSVGLTTGLDPAMTLGCGAAGGNITSDNISPMHLINIKRIAFEIREAQKASPQASPPKPSMTLEQKVAHFLDQKGIRQMEPKPQHTEPVPSEPAPTQAGQHRIFPIRPNIPAPAITATVIPNLAVQNPSQNSPQVIGPIDFVCEEDVRQAIARKQIIGIHSKTIITPSARDMASSLDIFKKIDK